MKVNRQNGVGDSKYCVVSYPLFTGYVTQPNFARQNRLTQWWCASVNYS